MPRLNDNMINDLVQKIDTQDPSLITWEEFLCYLEKEGELREMINDLRIN